MKLEETTEYNLEESYVKPKFKIEIKKEEINPIFLINLGGKMAYNGININVIEEKNSLIINLNDSVTISGDFTRNVEILKQKIVRIFTDLSLQYNLNIETNLIKTKTMTDVFEAKKANALKKENKENYFIFGNPNEFLEKNTAFNSLSIKIGNLFYSSDSYKDGYLGNFLKTFAEKHNITCKSRKKVLFNISKEELEELINSLEPN